MDAEQDAIGCPRPKDEQGPQPALAFAREGEMDMKILPFPPCLRRMIYLSRSHSNHSDAHPKAGSVQRTICNDG